MDLIVLMERYFDARYSEADVYDLLRTTPSADYESYGLYEYTGACPHLCAYAIRPDMQQEYATPRRTPCDGLD